MGSFARRRKRKENKAINKGEKKAKKSGQSAAGGYGADICRAIADGYGVPT